MNNIDIVYVSDSVDGLFLSYDTMVDLLIINEKFPTIRSCSKTDSDDSMFVKSLEADCPQTTAEIPFEVAQNAAKYLSGLTAYRSRLMKKTMRG